MFIYVCGCGTSVRDIVAGQCAAARVLSRHFVVATLLRARTINIVLCHRSLTNSLIILDSTFLFFVNIHVRVELTLGMPTLQQC